jgi:hypothetical protein
MDKSITSTFIYPPTYSILKDRVEDALRQAIDLGMSGHVSSLNTAVKMFMKEIFGEVKS